jgi:hypothetical protein
MAKLELPNKESFGLYITSQIMKSLYKASETLTALEATYDQLTNKKQSYTLN